MVTVVGVRFREVGKIYYFDPGELELKTGDNVIVDTVRGTEFGTVMIANRKVEDEEIVQPLKVVRRKATEDDIERVRTNREKEKSAFAVCKEKVRERGLDMKLISAEYTFDNAKILFYFTADGRVDFRELVKDLAAVFRIRIELRQVGVRDETKLMGGLGGCGRPLCCASYLSDFVPVSIRMAKEQNLSLNPQKISGVCGRLMCCLKNEADTYEDINTRIPKDGGKVITPDGREGIAESVNVLRERVRVLFTDAQGNREMEEFPASELKFTPRRKPKPCEIRAEQAAEIYDFDTATLAAEADEETDPDIKALVQAEEAYVPDVSDMSDTADMPKETAAGETEANMAGEKKHRRRHKKRAAEQIGERPEGRKAEALDNAGQGTETMTASENAQKAGSGSGQDSGRESGFEANSGSEAVSGDRSRRRRRSHRPDGAAGENEKSRTGERNRSDADKTEANNGGANKTKANKFEVNKFEGSSPEGGRHKEGRHGRRQGRAGSDLSDSNGRETAAKEYGAAADSNAGTGRNQGKNRDNRNNKANKAKNGERTGGDNANGGGNIKNSGGSGNAKAGADRDSIKADGSDNTSAAGAMTEKGTEKKHNGTYRRFRKRRPKDTAES